MEGFGLPNLEAVICGCIPVVSNIPVFKEIWAEILPMFDPYDITQMGRMIVKTINMNTKEKIMILEKAKKITSGYTWEKTAQMTLDLYQRIVK